MHAVFSLAGNGPTNELIQELDPILHSHGVQLYLSGHDHNLQLIEHQNSRLPQYIVSGAGGYNVHPALKPDVNASLNAGVRSRFSHLGHGFVALSISRDELKAEFVDSDAKMIHSAVIPHH